MPTIIVHRHTFTGMIDFYFSRLGYLTIVEKLPIKKPLILIFLFVCHNVDGGAEQCQ
jgi:hypothetical protein